ncbi:hypothetical protein CEXT_469091 [Caerostris extrusa]|uniref:Uncharacterized protein n=1 Tax=Caerostris extrusa TaxID=172846 RepID=A0AAV4XMJ6_CAEEX|nr:hypothetical protein CEXT_469091 [Caerostris extrusa]
MDEAHAILEKLAIKLIILDPISNLKGTTNLTADDLISLEDPENNTRNEPYRVIYSHPSDGILLQSRLTRPYNWTDDVTTPPPNPALSVGRQEQKRTKKKE